MFNPELESDPPAVVGTFANACYAADGMLWSSPMYNGSVSGSFKNAIDWLHMLGSREPPYLHDEVIGLISAAGGTQGLQVINTMEFSVRSLRGWAVPADVRPRKGSVSLQAPRQCLRVGSTTSHPALRATRVAAIAAVREGATLPPSRRSRARSVLLGVVGFTGAAVLAAGLFATGLGTAARLLLLASGAAFLFIGIAFVSRWLIVPLASALGRPFEALTGAAGLLARENSSRNPARTAVTAGALTAGALTVGLALVAFVATVGAGLRGTINDTVRQQIHADYVISADNASLPPTVSTPLKRYRTITATGIRQGQISVFGNTEQLGGVDPATIGQFYNFKWSAGSSETALARLGTTGAIITKQFAADHHLRIGSSISLQTESGMNLELTVRAIQTTPTFGALLGPVTISTQLFDRSFMEPADSIVLADTGGATLAAQRSLTNLLAGFPTAKVRTVPAFIKTALTGCVRSGRAHGAPAGNRTAGTLAMG